MRFKKSVAYEISNSLLKLDDIISKSQPEGSKNGNYHLKFDTEPAWNFAKNLRTAKQFLGDIDTQREDFIRKHNGGKATMDALPKDASDEQKSERDQLIQKLQSDWNALMNEEAEVDFKTFKKGDFNLGNADGKNNVPMGLLSGVSWLIEDF